METKQLVVSKLFNSVSFEIELSNVCAKNNMQ